MTPVSVGSLKIWVPRRSPGLQHTIAMEQLGAQVGGIPFFRYAMLRSVKLGKVQRVSVKCWNEDDDEMALRRAVVRRPHGTNGTAVGVDYVDGALPESEDDVILDRIVCGRDPETLRCNREVHAFVRDLSVAATSRAYMTGETLVHQGISWNDELFILVEGRAVVFDATRHAIHGKELVTPRTNSVVGRDICAYLCNRKKVPRTYTCKLLTHSLVYAVDAETFCDLLSRGHYKALYRGMAFYGAAQESEIPNFKGSYLGRFPLVSADFWTSDRLSERPRSVGAFSGTRARGTLTLKRR